MINSTQFGKNAIISNVISDYVERAKLENIDFNYHIISPPVLSMSNDDLINVLSKALDALFSLKGNVIFLNINVFSGKMQIECKSFQINEPQFFSDEVEEILLRNDGMLKTKFHNDEFVIQIIFPV